MTKIPVNMPDFVPQFSVGTGKAPVNGKSEGFEKVLENAKSTNTDVKTMEKKAEEEPADITQDKPEEMDKAEVNKPVETQEAEEVSKVEDSEQTSNEPHEGEEMDTFSQEEWNLLLPMLQIASADVKELLAQNLEITVEELNGILEDMSVNELDLLDAEELKNLFLQLKGADDMTSLLTDEQLYTGLQNLESGFAEIIETVQETSGISEDDLMMLKEQMNVTQNDTVPVITVESSLSVEGSGKGEGAQTGSGKGEQNTNSELFMQSFGSVSSSNVLEQVVNLTEPAGTFMSSETENIMNQILDYMKIQLNVDTSELEMQLQPESLGTLQIKISAKEGVMTAQFTTASESVKAALESQMVVLQQQLENQNVKVDAIEVTVQTHQFESALEQGKEQHTKEDNRKNRSRKIDLSNLDDVKEMNADDRIVAEMMAANGNTVDYLA